MPKSTKLSLKFSHIAAFFCLLPACLWAQNAKFGHFLSTNTPGATSTVAFKGYAGQPVVGIGTLTESSTMIGTGYVRVIRQATFIPPTSADHPAPVVFTFGLGQNFPNPFNPSTVIPFTLDHAANASLAIYNLLGQQVRSFDLSNLIAGEYQITWDGKTNNGSPLPSGEYFARLAHDSRMQVRKLTLLK